MVKVSQDWAPRRTINAATTPGMACATPKARTGPPGLEASPASPCTSAATLPESSGDSPVASSVPARPASTSPDPAVASHDGASAWERTARPQEPGGTTSVVAPFSRTVLSVSYTHLRAHETVLDLVCRL